MYLGNFLEGDLRGPVGLNTLDVFGLLKLGPLSNGGPRIAVFIPPLVAPLAPSTFETVLAPYEEGRHF
jgi:hypothetical protein